MEDWKVRLQKETEDLSSKLAGLNAFISSGQIDELSYKQGDLLMRQRDVMTEYYDILVARCNLNDIVFRQTL